MSYVDAIHDRDSDKIVVVERNANGNRTYHEHPTNYTFYYSDPKGKYRSLYGDAVSRFSTRKRTVERLNKVWRITIQIDVLRDMKMIQTKHD